MITSFTKKLKLFLCLAAGTFVAGGLQAQTTGGPDTYGYIWRDSNDPNGPAYSWVDVPTLAGATMVTGLADDNIRGPYAVGFPFHFYWYDVTTFRIGSNGYLAFAFSPSSTRRRMAVASGGSSDCFLAHDLIAS